MEADERVAAAPAGGSHASDVTAKRILRFKGKGLSIVRLSDSFPHQPDPQKDLRRGRRGEVPASTTSPARPGSPAFRAASLRLVREDASSTASGPTARAGHAGQRAARAAEPGSPSPNGPQRSDGFRGPFDSDRQARRAITQSNVESAFGAALDPQDPRWLVATETASQLEGSLLTFERRRKVLALANRVGVRPFDANLIIAAVQDRARRGEPIDYAMPTVALTARPRRPGGSLRTRLLSRQAIPYLITALVAVLAHAVGIGAVIWLLLA
jgi:hypothetical protein